MPVGEVPDVFDGVEDQVPQGLADHIRGIQLVDHHVHGAFNKPVDRAGFEASINEGSTDPVPDFMTMFDSPLGLAIRRWCAPVLGLPAISVPTGLVNGLPMGVQIVGPRFREDLVMDAAEVIEAIKKDRIVVAKTQTRR